MNIRARDISITIPLKWATSINEAAARFNTYQRICLNSIEVKDNVLNLCAADVSSFLQWLPESLSEFEGYQLRVLLSSKIKEVGSKKRAQRTIDYYEMCSSSIKDVKPNFSHPLEFVPPFAELHFAQ